MVRLLSSAAVVVQADLAPACSVVILRDLTGKRSSSHMTVSTNAPLINWVSLSISGMYPKVVSKQSNAATLEGSDGDEPPLAGRRRLTLRALAVPIARLHFSPLGPAHTR